MREPLPRRRPPPPPAALPIAAAAPAWAHAPLATSALIGSLLLLAQCCCYGLAADAGLRKGPPPPAPPTTPPAQGQCPDPALYEHSAAAGRCCRRCQPGHGVWRPCDAHNDTVCDPCREGVTFSPAEARKGYHLQQCTACSPSPDHAVVTRQCNATHDTQWECKRGFYFNSSSRKCVQCLSCAEGWGVLAACDQWTDARCIKCPDGTYSSAASTGVAGGDGAAVSAAAPRSCIVCTKCSASQVTLQDCTSTQDTVCLDIKKTKGSESGAQQRVPAPYDERPTQSPGGASGGSSEFPTVPLYCAILGTVVVGLLLYVVIRCRPNRARKHKELGAAKAPVKADLVALLNGAGKVATVTPHVLHYSEVSVSKKKDVAALLHRQDVAKEQNWQGLARLLGFTQPHINEITERAQRDGGLAAHSMLDDWCRHCGSSATLNALVHSLRRLGRADVVHQLTKMPGVSHGVHGNELP